MCNHRSEIVSDFIVRIVTVNRDRNAQEALDATGRKQYKGRDKVVDRMPKALTDKVEIVFFKPGRYILDADLKKEYELRGLTPADPFSVAALNEVDPAFADEKPHGTYWKDENGNWCCATFWLWYSERRVDVGRHDEAWHDGWWFAGIRK